MARRDLVREDDVIELARMIAAGEITKAEGLRILAELDAGDDA